MLTADMLRSLLRYDATTGVFTRTRGVRGQSAGAIVGCRALNGYVVIRLAQRLYLAHRLAWLYVTGEWPAEEIDHLDCDRANNRFANLRAAGRALNATNERRARPNNKLGVLGVYFNTQKRKYVATISVNRKHKHLGAYPTAELAHDAYVRAKRALHEGCTL